MKRVLSLVLAVVMLVGLLPAISAGAEKADVPGNAIWAKKIIEHVPGDPYNPDDDQNINGILGIADADYNDDSFEFPLGKNGYIVVDFGVSFDNNCSIYVFEVGSSLGGATETVELFVSSDLKTWHPVGSTNSEISCVSLNESLPNGLFRYLKIKDSGENSYNSYPGADIDAIALVPPENMLYPVATTNWNGHTYHVYDESMTWEEAKQYCENSGGHLVTITSEEENNIISNLISNSNYTKSMYWIGGYKDGDWKWITGESFDYTNWN